MTTERDKKVVAYIKSIYEIVGKKEITCMDKTITYYRAYDKPSRKPNPLGTCHHRVTPSLLYAGL